jgi:hypothetical protein
MNRVRQGAWRGPQIVAVCLLVVAATEAAARKGNEPVYSDPFDIAGGGASLTRASKEGRIYANPALMAYGGKFHRWFGLTVSALSTRETIGTAQKIAQGSSDDGQSEEQSDERGGEREGGDTQEFVDTLFESPVRVGWGAALSYVSANVGLGAFSRFEPDFRARKFGQHGLPEVVFTAESYHGGALALASQAPVRWLSFGLTFKYIYALEPDVAVEVSDQESIRGLQDQNLTPDVDLHYRGMGADAGVLLFFQGKHVDLSLAGKVDDGGGLAFVEGAKPAPKEYAPQDFRQVVSGGAGLTLHSTADAIHFAVDYRDILNAYEEEQFKKVYAGTKIILRTYLGLAAGFYHGYPSMGAELDLLLLRLAVTTYTRELGDHPGVDPRRIVMGSISMGF